MSEAFSDEVKQQIVIAAATVAGKDATPGDVATQVTRIAGYLNPNSEVQRAFANIDKRAEQTASSAGFVATIIGFAKEETSNRGVVLFHSSVTTHTPEAKEFLRTEILEPGGSAVSLMRAIQGNKDPEKGPLVESLIGHKVSVSFDRVKKTDGSGHTVRVLQSITDRGADPEYDFSKPEYQPVFYTDEAKAKSMSKNTFHPRVTVAA